MASWRQQLRRLMPLSMRRFAHRAGVYLGDWMYLDTLQRRGFRPAFMIDIGAYHGDWSAFARRLFPSADILMIEGQRAQLPLLEGLCRTDPRLTVAGALLGAHDGDTVRFALHETGSSVYPEGGSTDRMVEQALTRLDTLLNAQALATRRIDLLKLDVQGYELQVLAGAVEALQRTSVVVLEASLLPINRGCPLLHEVSTHMNAAGFRLIDIGAQTRLHSGALWQTDLVYAREGTPWVVP